MAWLKEGDANNTIFHRAIKISLNKCCLDNYKFKSAAVFWRPPPLGWIKFNVYGVAKEGKVGCGGVLRDMKGVARALFLGSVIAYVVDVDEASAVKARKVVFSMAERKGNEMAGSLAIAGVNRENMFKAW
ncbi:hypothetical protein PVK06_007569 [Gossypium arboreum]|uniref:Uncharacterized protein n=1 Tax=Gossypium arboreum TaxID=29729 RepID=A0ABR0QHW5_GOSAR|nr:hypothetical protein PVK06_007569 [Gossypium arboreum]